MKLIKKQLSELPEELKIKYAFRSWKPNHERYNLLTEKCIELNDKYFYIDPLDKTTTIYHLDEEINCHDPELMYLGIEYEMKVKKKYSYFNMKFTLKITNYCCGCYQYKGVIYAFYDDERIDVFVPFEIYYFYKYNLPEPIYEKNIMMNDLTQEFFKTKDKFPEKHDINFEETVRIQLKDQVIISRKETLYKLRSEYINNLIENIQENEILCEFQNLILEEFLRLYSKKWIKNHKIFNISHKIYSVYYNYQIKSLYSLAQCEIFKNRDPDLVKFI